MSRRAFTLEAKAEAIAMVGLVGASIAADTLGIDRRTLIKWSQEAGHRSELDVEPDVWRRLHDAATRRVEAMLGSGKLRATEVATIGAIARRNLSAPAERPEPATSVEQAFDTFEKWISTTFTVDADAALAVVLNDPRMADDAPEPDDAMAHMQLVLTDLLTVHGTLAEALKAQRIERQAKAEAQVAASRVAAEERRQAEINARLDDETRELLAAAEAWLAEHAS